MDAFTFYNADNMNGMNNDNEPQQNQPNSARYATNAKPKLSPDQMAKQFAINVGAARGDSYIIREHLERQVEHAWIQGYCFGNNEVMEKFSEYVAKQPPAPIVVDRSEISLSTYKMFIREKIKRDSGGKWWLKLKLWWRFIWAQ